MRKISLAFISLVLLLGLTACSSIKEPTSSDDSNNVKTSQNSQDSTSNSSNSDTDTTAGATTK